MRKRMGRRRGFSLLELGVIGLVIAVLAGLGLSALKNVQTRSKYSSAANDLGELLKNARAQAFGQGVPTVVFFPMTSGGSAISSVPKNRFGTSLATVAFADLNGDFTLATYAPASAVNGATSPDKSIGTIEVTQGVSASSTGYGAALPAPYAWVPSTSACSFCDSSKGGAITFHSDGRATLTGSNSEGGSITITDGNRKTTYAIVARTGAVRVFEK